MPKRDLLLEVQDLRVAFYLHEGVVKAVDGVSFDLSRHTTTGIVGESGCGKSVTARAILQILDRGGKITNGSILFHRAPTAPVTTAPPVVDLALLEPDSAEMRAIRGAEIAMIFQEPMTAFSPVHTIGFQMIETIELHQRVGKAAARDKAEEMLHRVGISRPAQCLDAYVHQLSGGMRQRAMIGLALSCQPSLLIADEPTTAIDVTTQAQILELMSELQQEFGMSVMLITHDLGVVAEMADQVLVMYLGQVVEQAPVDDIFHDPKHPYTQSLLRSIPKLGSRSGEKLETIRGSIPGPYARPSGCKFHPRCPAFMPGRCDVIEPALKMLDDGRWVSCLLYEKE
jgi:oligopeptide/dipeptide ABC transporter ATP-binding protein